MKLFFLFSVLLFSDFSNGVTLPIKKNSSSINLFSQNLIVQQKTTPSFPKHNKENVLQAKGIILKFHNWPDIEEEKLIISFLENKDLVKKSAIERFKIWIFEWPKENGLVKAQQLCDELLKHPGIFSLEYCEPDHLVETTSDDYGAAGKREIADARSGIANAEKAVGIAKQALSSAEKRAARIKNQMATDPGLVIRQNKVRRAEAALQNARRRLARAIRTNSHRIERIRRTVNRLERLVAIRKKDVENRKKWFQNKKKAAENKQNKLLEARRVQLKKAEQWLENRKQNLKRVLSKHLPAQEKEKRQKDSTTENISTTRASTHNQPATQPSGNLRTCDIVSSKFGLFENKLSDYWAQEMVGADLLKEEVKKADPVEKKLVEAFDVRRRDHDFKVRNIISHKGPHSVLPELGDNIGISNVHYISDILKVADRLLSKADRVCNTSS